ncbi:glycosyltransferase family 2 protein [Cyclobacterium sediminis]
MAKISIVIPVYNREKLIIETLNSINNQTYQDWECLLVDDHSTDKSLEVMNNIALTEPRIKVYSRPKTLKKGAPSCRNYGVNLAIGEFIQFFDSDDLMLPSMLKIKVDFLTSRKNLDFIVSKMADFTTPDNWETPTYKTESLTPAIDSLNYNIRFLTPGPLFLASFLKNQKQLFDPLLKRNQEWEFFSRILMEGARYDSLNEVTCLRRIHPNSIKSNFENSKEDEREGYKLIAVHRMNLNSDKKFKLLFIKVFWRFYIRSFFIFLRKGQVSNLLLWLKAVKNLVL